MKDMYVKIKSICKQNLYIIIIINNKKTTNKNICLIMKKVIETKRKF